MRADAKRNYDRLLAAADAAFRAHGTDASLEAVARSAGVATGTLYGHFPTRRALVAALLRDRNQALFALANDLSARLPAAGALNEWTAAAVAHAAAYSGLATLLAGGIGDETSELHAACAQLAGIGERLVAAAREAGDLRPDVTGTDLFTLVSAAAWTRDQVPPDQADRLLHIGLRGLRTG